MKGMSTNNFISQVCINWEVYIWYFKVQSLRTRLRNISCENLINPWTQTTVMAKHFDGLVDSLSLSLFFHMGYLLAWFDILIDIAYNKYNLGQPNYYEYYLSWMGHYFYYFLTCADRIRRHFVEWQRKK